MGAGVSLPGGRDNALSDFKPSQGRYPIRRAKTSQDTFRTIHLKKETEIREVAVIGTTVQIPLDEIVPEGARSFIVQTTHPYHVDIRHAHETTGIKPTNITFQSFIPLQKESRLLVDALRPTNKDIQIIIDFDFEENDKTAEDNFPKQRYHFMPSILWLRLIYLSIDVDADRDGIVEHNSPFKDFWNWGTDGCGPILAVRGDEIVAPYQENNLDSDGEKDDKENKSTDKPRPINTLEYTALKVRSMGSEKIPKGYQLSISVEDKRDDEENPIVRSVALYLNNGSEKSMIGQDTNASQWNIPWPVAGTGASDDVSEIEILVEGFQLYDGTSNSLEFIPIILNFSKGDEVVYEDRLELRVCPWIVPSPLADPESLFIVDNGRRGCSALIDAVSRASEEAGAYITKLPEQEVTSHPDGDALSKWICCGFTQTVGNVKNLIAVSKPTKTTEETAKHLIMSSDFEYFTIGKRGYFDKMMATPAMYPDFPIGALLVATLSPGGQIPGDWKRGNSDIGFIPRPLGDFLDAQQVQPLVEVFTDWLEGGDITNMVNFVPCRSSKGFKVVMPSIHICRDLLIDFRKNGEGYMRAGKSLDGEDAAIKVTDVLNDRDFWKINQHFQNFIDWNKQRLRWQLGLLTDDFIEIPALWQQGRGHGSSRRAVPFFPNMTTLINLGGNVVIPKPHGPKRSYDNPQDRLERYMVSEFKARQITAELHFVDDWDCYFDRHGPERSSLYKHLLVQRRPGSHPAWWELDMK
ncbi:protein-arginine deiminase type-2-like [Ptychodera flava]|uniref:protein-arginine deiminase type-2-like n=1 Tax=Ptychodera flava TaxID=63121 RepID=UPI003969CF38